MKQVVYTCTRCSKQLTVQADQDVVPFEWAEIGYSRFHAGQKPEQTLHTTSTTHACGDCAQAVLDDLKRPRHTNMELRISEGS